MIVVETGDALRVTRTLLNTWPVRVTVSGAPLVLDLRKRRPSTWHDQQMGMAWDAFQEVIA